MENLFLIQAVTVRLWALCLHLGITYIIFTIEEIMNLMNLGNKKVNKMLIELEQHGLIYRRHQVLGKPNKIYVHNILQPETSEWTPEIQLKKWRNRK